MLLALLLAACAPAPTETGTLDMGEPVPYCDTLTDEEKALFDVVSVAGSSNSYDILGTEDWSVPTLGPYGPGEYSAYYPGILVDLAWSQLQECGVAQPVLWVNWYSRVGEQPTDTTFFLALDAFYHFLDDDPDLEVLRERVRDYLTTQSALAPDAPFIVGNVPTVLMYYVDRTFEEKEAYNTAIQEEVLAWPGYSLVDLDTWMDHLVAGEVEYQGVDLSPFDVMKDGLHLNETGQLLMAQIGLYEINARFPNLLLPDVADIAIEGE